MMRRILVRHPLTLAARTPRASIREPVAVARGCGRREQRGDDLVCEPAHDVGRIRELPAETAMLDPDPIAVRLDLDLGAVVRSPVGRAPLDQDASRLPGDDAPNIQPVFSDATPGPSVEPQTLSLERCHELVHERLEGVWGQELDRD